MTTLQKQCLLAYLGFSPGAIDGAWGEKTRAAVAAFQRAYGLPETGECNQTTEKAVLDAVYKGMPAKKQEKTGTFWDDIRYFTREEFRCPCGKCGGFPNEPKEKLVRMADAVRAHFDAPATVSSGVRCKEHNAAVGGVGNSRHLSGQAADIAIRGCSAAKVLSYVRSLPECAYAYSITSAGKETGYVHMDVIV